MANKYAIRILPVEILLFSFLLLFIPAFAESIPKSRIEVMAGKIRTVDTSNKILVVRISKNKQYNAYDMDETVKVTENSIIMKGGQSISLDRLNPGDTLTIKYYDDDVGLDTLISATVKE